MDRRGEIESIVMPWRKDRPYAPGELEFHLTGLREMRGEHAAPDLDMDRVQKKLAKREAKHRQ
ncbi:MAG TPA: hypothetical protein VM889_03980 [Candidatus Thermoplasmatota archaeon]|nr:hypothetical protein [Candidatus Thermoplasmatota archaeon]